MQTYRKLKWKEINRKQAEMYVNRLQVRIEKAVQDNKWRLVKRLQKLVTNSFYAKALAVRRVITNKGKKTLGISRSMVKRKNGYHKYKRWIRFSGMEF